MKKAGAFCLLLLAIVLTIFLIHNISADIVDVDYSNPENTRVLGINPSDVPQSPEEFQKSSFTWLKKAWDNLIKNSKILGPIIEFLNPMFRVFTGYEFEISLEFFVALILSLVLLVIYFRGINSFYNDSLVSFTIASLISVISASAGLMHKIVPKVLTALSSNAKIISFFIISFLIIIIIDYSYRIHRKSIKEKALENLGRTEKKMNESSERLESITEGMEEAKDAYDKN
mgnify:CR=1 FL=1